MLATIFNKLATSQTEPKRILSSMYKQALPEEALLARPRHQFLSFEANRKNGVYYITGTYGLIIACPPNMEVPGYFNLHGAVLKIFELEQQALAKGWQLDIPSFEYPGQGVALIAAKFNIGHPNTGTTPDVPPPQPPSFVSKKRKTHLTLIPGGKA